MSLLPDSIAPYGPVVLLLLVGVLPSEIWRVAAALLAHRVDEQSDVFVLARLVSAGLVAALVARLLVQPPPALSVLPLWVRLGVLPLAVGVYYATGRSLVRGVLVGAAAVVVGTAYYSAS